MECWEFIFLIVVVMGITTAMLDLVYKMIEKHQARIFRETVKKHMSTIQMIARQRAAGVE